MALVLPRGCRLHQPECVVRVSVTILSKLGIALLYYASQTRNRLVDFRVVLGSIYALHRVSVLHGDAPSIRNNARPADVWAVTFVVAMLVNWSRSAEAIEPRWTAAGVRHGSAVDDVATMRLFPGNSFRRP